ncbi:MAG: ATP-binding cassette domain-containing protein [Lachnospiraceae bacterium]|nr:ATP-binding cassette domain-containing protein [Lachnospiraceae bacterium]
MEQIKISHLTFSYGEENTFSLKDISFTVEQGEILLIIGESGCGKTTLLRHLKKDYMPSGKRGTDSRILIAGEPIEELEEKEQAGRVGFVRQNADAALVTDKVWHELAFGLENLGYPQETMQRKIAEMTAFFGLEGIYHEEISKLSGGQKQIVNLASVMVMEPEVLVLDEPTSQLDPIAATEFFHMIEKIHREIGTTIVLTEHRLEEVFSLCDKVMVLEQGKVLMEGSPRQVASGLYRDRNSLYRSLPAAATLYLRLEGQEKTVGTTFENQVSDAASAGMQEIPLTVSEGKKWLESRYEKQQFPAKDLETFKEETEDFFSKERKKNLVLSADEIWFRYEPESRDIIKACSMELEGEKITAILGGNGAGKSTLLHILAGHYKVRRGKVKVMEGSIGMLPQNPQAMFVKKTVKEELELSGKCQQDEEGAFVKDGFGLEEIIDFCNLGEVLGQHPFDLSGGQMQKLALAKLLLEDYDILLLDEPGKGMDYAFKLEMGKLLKRLTGMGKTILMVSHDVEFCARYADICGLFFDGHIVSVSKTRTFFRQNVFYTTAVTRICKNIFPKAVIMEDVLEAFGVMPEEEKHICLASEESVRLAEGRGGNGEKDIRSPESMERNGKEDGRSAKDSKRDGRPPDIWKASGNKKGCKEILLSSNIEIPEEAVLDNRGKGRRNYLVSLIIFFAVMPVTIYIGHSVLQQRKYYFIAMLLVLEAILSFFLSFEKRKPSLRESMVIVVLSAVTVAGRAAFYMVPHAKPMAALIILSGAGLGGEAGFLVGALAMLVSNIFFGQGPWTPWQMFAMGILGFVSGIVFRQDRPCGKKKKYGICVLGFASVIILYGGIMNPASVLMYQENVNWEMILSAYAMGLPFDLIHAAFTFLFLWLGAGPILEKIGRIRRKIY